MRGQREQQQVVVKHLMGMVLFERVALSGAGGSWQTPRAALLAGVLTSPAR